jgi:DNA-binding transcriptional LysR family regulator
MQRACFALIHAKPRIAVECDSASSLIMEVESGGIALLNTVFKRVAGKRLLFRPLIGTSDASPPVGIARATNGDVTPAREKFCEILRKDWLSELPRGDGSLRRAEAFPPPRREDHTQPASRKSIAIGGLAF